MLCKITAMVRLKLEDLIKKRKLDGISNRALAKQIGVSHVALYKMREELPYNPTLSMLDRLCTFFKCKVEDLLEFKK